MSRPSRQTLETLTLVLPLTWLAATSAEAQAQAPALTLHPQGALLPFSHQGPFVTTGDGGVLCVAARQALHSRDEGQTWTATPVFRDEQRYHISNERALLRTGDGVVVIQFGINDAAVDVWRQPPATESRVRLTEYEENLRWLVTTLREHQARPVLMTTNPTRWTPKLLELYGRAPYQPAAVDGFDAPVLALYNEAVRRLSTELGVPLVDVHAAFVAAGAETLLLDGMHPNDTGHQRIAELLVPVLREQLR